jgi:hypothetical protein
MDFNFFEDDIFCQIFNMNLNKIIWNFFQKIKIFFQEYSKNILRIFPQKLSQK